MPESPLSPCPGPPNCVRRRRAFGLAPGTLFEKAQDALGEMGPSELTVRGEAKRVEAVFRVFFFKDDVAVAVTPGENDGGAVLHVRNASRVGTGDLGVNRRRVRRFFRKLSAAINQQSASRSEEG